MADVQEKQEASGQGGMPVGQVEQERENKSESRCAGRGHSCKSAVDGVSAEVDTSVAREPRRNLRREGARYEKIAGAFLTAKGFRVVRYNFRYRKGEIDIIAWDGNYLVFVEVKYRSSARSGSPFEAVDTRKQYTICRCADFFRIRYHIAEEVPCRFDVVGIQGKQIEHIENAFAYIPY